MAYLLIVDDDEDFGTFAAHVLRDAGHEVTVEVEIERAVRNMEERRPALAILDVMFPDNPTAGLALARGLRRNRSTREMPIIMLTGVNQEFQGGINPDDPGHDWLPVQLFQEKPADIRNIADHVSELLRQTLPQDKHTLKEVQHG